MCRSVYKRSRRLRLGSVCARAAVVTLPSPTLNMNAFTTALLYFLLLSVIVTGKHKKLKQRQRLASPSTKGIQCYNCLSFDHPGCWDPDHPDYANITIPSIDCYIPGMAFLCIVITSESAKLVETGQDIGPVRARTCVPAKDFSKKTVPYSTCAKLSNELSASEIFSRITVSRPQCTLCKKHLCTEPPRC